MSENKVQDISCEDTKIRGTSVLPSTSDIKYLVGTGLQGYIKILGAEPVNSRNLYWPRTRKMFLFLFLSSQILIVIYLQRDFTWRSLPGTLYRSFPTLFRTQSKLTLSWGVPTLPSLAWCTLLQSTSSSHQCLGLTTTWVSCHFQKEEITWPNLRFHARVAFSTS